MLGWLLCGEGFDGGHSEAGICGVGSGQTCGRYDADAVLLHAGQDLTVACHEQCTIPHEYPPLTDVARLSDIRHPRAVDLLSYANVADPV